VQDIPYIFINRPLQHAWGIASKLEKRLKSIGIYTLDDLQKASPFYLKTNLGMYGYYLWCHVNGIEVEGVDTTRGSLPKSIGHSYCVPQQTTDKKYLQGIMAKLAWRAAARMRLSGLQTSKLMCGFSYLHQGGVWHSWKLPVALYSSTDIVKESLRIFFEPIEHKVRLVAVSLGDLAPISHQLSLFDSHLKKKNLTYAIDKVNQQYGEGMILPGSLLAFKLSAPDRIGFRKSVRPEEIE
jgi:nucleotidyltransferase/DNA polymerase involved in DNA repair